VNVCKRLEWICENWQLPDAGIWEMRNRPEQLVYSKIMNWVAWIAVSGWPTSVRFPPTATRPTKLATLASPRSKSVVERKL
jgi:hypothetical protein